MSHLTEIEIEELGLTVGRSVRISPDARFFGTDRIRLGDNVRIDAFCVISSGRAGHVEIGSHIHVASGVRIFGDGGVSLADFSSVSAASTLYSASDDYSGQHLMGPQMPLAMTSVDRRPLRLERLAAIGAHSLVLPGVTLSEGAVLGAMSLANTDLEAWTIYAGIPCRPIRTRDRAASGLADAVEESWDHHESW